jgi:hypothetical protein
MHPVHEANDSPLQQESSFYRRLVIMRSEDVAMELMGGDDHHDHVVWMLLQSKELNDIGFLGSCYREVVLIPAELFTPVRSLQEFGTQPCIPAGIFLPLPRCPFVEAKKTPKCPDGYLRSTGVYIFVDKIAKQCPACENFRKYAFNI